MEIMDNAAFVAVDVQNGFADAPGTRRAAESIINFLRQYRGKFALTTATRFFNTPGSQFVRLVDWDDMMTPPRTNLVDGLAGLVDVTLDKTTYVNAGDIARLLDARGIRDVYLAGIDTDVCVLQNAATLFDMGYAVRVPLDLCASNGGEKIHEAAGRILERTIGSRQVFRGGWR